MRMLADVVGQRLDAVDAELGHHLAAAAAEPLSLQAIRENRSPSTCTGSRTFARTIASRSSFTWPCARERHDRHAQPLLEHLAAVGPEAAPADVHHVHRRSEQPHRPVAEKRRRHQREVVQVAGSQPRVIGEVVIACPHLLDRETREEMADRRRHRVHVPGRAGHSLRQHPPLEIEHPGGEVAGFTHARAERGAQQRLRLLLDDGDQAVPHDLRADAGQCRSLSSFLVPARTMNWPPRRQGAKNECLQARSNEVSPHGVLTRRVESSEARSLGVLASWRPNLLFA